MPVKKTKISSKKTTAKKKAPVAKTTVSKKKKEIAKDVKKSTSKTPKANSKKTTTVKSAKKNISAKPKKVQVPKSTKSKSVTIKKSDSSSKGSKTSKNMNNKKTTAKSIKKVASKKPQKVSPQKTITKKVENKPDLNQQQASEKSKTRKLPKVRYSNQDLELFKKRIDDVRSEAIDELRMLRERLDDLTNYDFAEESMIYSMHMAEQGSEAFEKEKTYAQIQRINEYIKKLDEALNRIKDKTYGICRVCGCLIAKERLMAVPITTLSASYKIQQMCPEDGVDKIEPLKKSD